ncbi:MAG: ABC transporter substrate-binding protein, partial [Coriobacteriales bacterium]|nr:ABC transporter substrate-binding protein [Coriobacteriales bacterium]
MTNNLTRRSFLAGGSLAAAGLALASCGQQGQGTDDSSAKDLTKLTFCLDWAPNTNHTGIYVAEAKGFFADEGLAVKIVQPAEDGAEAMVGTGQVQL